MPHFQHLILEPIIQHLDVYKNILVKIIITIKDIQWKNLRKFLQDISETEEELCIIEMKKRDKLEKNLTLKYPVIKDLESLTSVPMLDRGQEKYINIGDNGWQKRYYKELFNLEIDDLRKQQICLNYLEGLEWNFKYYTDKCPDWGWCYKYKYPY